MNVSTFPQITAPAFVFRFEKDFDDVAGRRWMEKNWHQAFYYIAVYLAVVFGGQAYMKNRPKFEIRGFLMVWNMFLAVFSIVGSFRTVPELYHSLMDNGFLHSVCSTDHAVPSMGFWAWAFVLSKLPELGDTVFIVLRKQKLVFLHWYHHITVLLFCWYSYQQNFATGRWYIAMNFFVHSMMYTYYALKAMKVSIPRWIAMMITSSQIAQMVFGLIVSWWAFQAKQRGEPCHITDDTAKIALSMYLSYFFLFAKLFYNSYIAPPKTKPSLAKME